MASPHAKEIVPTSDIDVLAKFSLSKPLWPRRRRLYLTTTLSGAICFTLVGSSGGKFEFNMKNIYFRPNRAI